MSVLSVSNRFFQFIRGERKGEVVIFDEIIQDDNLIFVQFRDKSRCNEELILPLNERDVQKTHIMAEVSDPTNIWKFEDEWVGKEKERTAKNANGEVVIISPASPGKKKIKIIPPRKVNSSFGRINQIMETPKPKEEEIPKPADPVEIDPVYGMMKASKKFPTIVGVEMEILLPRKSLFDVAKESFEDGDKKVIEYIIENLDISKLKDALRNALYDAYGNPVEPEVTRIHEPITFKKSGNITGMEIEPVALEEPVIGAPEPQEKIPEEIVEIK